MRTIRINIWFILIVDPKSSLMTKTEFGIPSGNTALVGVGSAAETSAATQLVTSESLLGERGELKIQHNGEQYSLRRTRHGKLILTK